MKITKSKLKNIIQEELQKLLHEQKDPMSLVPREAGGKFETTPIQYPRPAQPTGGGPRASGGTAQSIAPQTTGTQSHAAAKKSFADWTADVKGPRDVAKGTTSAPYRQPAEKFAKLPVNYGAQPKRMAGMSTKYLQKRGYAWDPTKGTMMHKTKGDVRDVAKAWSARKGRKGKGKQSQLAGLLGQEKRFPTKRPSKPTKRQGTFRQQAVATPTMPAAGAAETTPGETKEQGSTKSGGPKRVAMPWESDPNVRQGRFRQGESRPGVPETKTRRAGSTFDYKITGEVPKIKTRAQQRIDKIEDPVVRRSVQQKYDQRQEDAATKRAPIALDAEKSPVPATPASDPKASKAYTGSRHKFLKDKLAQKKTRKRATKKAVQDRWYDFTGE